MSDIADPTDDQLRHRAIEDFVRGPVADVVRSFFKRMWRKKYDRDWDSTGTDKSYLCGYGELCCRDYFLIIEEEYKCGMLPRQQNKIPKKSLQLTDDQKKMIRNSSNPDDWDLSLLFSLLLNSYLCHPINHTRCGEHVALETLRDFKNLNSSHGVEFKFEKEVFDDWAKIIFRCMKSLGSTIKTNPLMQFRLPSETRCGKLEQWLQDYFQSPIPQPTFSYEADESVVPSDTFTSPVACIWFQVSFKGERLAVTTPGVGTDSVLYIGNEELLRNAISEGSIREACVEEGRMKLILGLSDSTLCAKHCCVYNEGGEWFVKKLGEQKTTLRRQSRKFALVSELPVKIFHGDSIIVNRLCKLYCHTSGDISGESVPTATAIQPAAAPVATNPQTVPYTPLPIYDCDPGNEGEKYPAFWIGDSAVECNDV